LIEASGGKIMAIILFNPTNEDFETQYTGETIMILAGAKIKVDDPRGRHILNTLGPRGLVTLEYGDEGAGEDKKANDGISRNKAFKRKQVLDFNQNNQQRLQGKMPYLSPSRQLKKYAEELGIGLEEPYKVIDSANEEMARLIAEKESLEKSNKKKDAALEVLQSQVADLTSKFHDFLTLAGKPVPTENDMAAGEAKAAKEKKELDGIRASFKMQGKKQFIKWVSNNWNLIQQYPEAIKGEIADRHLHLYGIPMPAEAPIINEYDIA
jgi:hypothetical protein